MVIETDECGRLPLPESVRERYGDRFYIATEEDRIVLFPVADDPLVAVRDSVGELSDSSIEAIRTDIECTARSQSNSEDQGKK